VFAPLANRLGIWQIKWELEDLAFRFLQPDDYRRIARLLDEKRLERELPAWSRRAPACCRRAAAAGLRPRCRAGPSTCTASGRRCRARAWPRAVFDLRALRVIVDDVPPAMPRWPRARACRPVDGEFDDYIARPRPTATRACTPWCWADDGRPLEVQIRTRAMHEHAEHGVAAHWAYKEAGAKGYAGVSASGDFEERLAEARKAVLRQLLAWERDFSPGGDSAWPAAGAFDDRIYVFTPQATIIDLPAGATPVDFAYTLHTDLGHRCRGARVDGAMVPLNTPLQHGQTVEIVAAKDGGPSLDWLNPELGYLRSPRARAKVRAWFNALAQAPPSRAAASWWKSCCSAKAAPRWKLDTWPSSWASRAPTRCSRWWARTSSRCATSRTCCARPSRAGRRPPLLQALAHSGGGAVCWWWAWTRC
jgi:GTP pyrophosphokinase